MKSLFRFLIITHLVLFTCPSICIGGTHSANLKQGKKGCAGSDYFDPVSGNVLRVIVDLEVSGGVGETALVWKRYGSSRSGKYTYNFGTAHNWNASFMITMSDDGTDESGQPQLIINFPDEGDYNFIRDMNDTTHWASLPGVDRQVYQDGNNFYLQLANGYRYRFEKLTRNSGDQYYQLQDFRDCYQNIYSLTYNTKGKLKKITEPAGRYISITYGPINDKAVITQVSTSDGRSVSYNYDIFNDGITDWVRLISVDYGDGTQASYEYSQTSPGNRPHLSHAIDPRDAENSVNMKYTYQSDVQGFIKEEINGVTDEVMFTLTANSADKIVCYANGRVDFYTAPNSLFCKVSVHTDGLGRTTSYTYENDGGFMKTESDALGRVTTYNKRTIYGNPLKITYPDGTTEKWIRDDLDLILTHTDELGRITSYTRDSNHRVTRIDYADGTFETFTYNGFGQVLDHQMRNLGVEHFVYDSRGLKTNYTDALGNLETYMYDSADRLASLTDARENTTNYEYNERGLMTRMINADGSFQTHAYDDFGNRTTFTDEAGHAWTTAYDEFKRVVSKTDPLNRTTLYSYDLPGNICGCTHDYNKPTMITLPSGRTTTYQYDVEWQLIGRTEGAGTADEATTSYEYDMVGKLVTTIDPRGNSWTNEYDLRNRKISSTNPLGHETQWTYDKVGNNLTVIRPDGGVTTNKYDDMNRITQTTNANAEITKFKYDAEGNMVKLTDANNHSYVFEYDSLNRKTKMIYPGGSFEQWTYNEVSNVATYTNRAGDVCTYTYDNRNRETFSDWSDNTPDVNSTYSADNLQLTMSSSVSTLTYTYNAAHELTSETQAIAGGPTHTISYTYNADGLRSTMTNPDGSMVSYDYTGRNQPATISVDAAPPLVTYTYELNGNRLTKVLENGTNSEYTWDEANRNTSIDHQNSSGSFARFDYGYDNVNRRTYVQHDFGNGDTYSYDAIHQITDVKYDVTDPAGTASNPIRTVNYAYDLVGNRNTVTDNAIPTPYSANNKNQYTDVGNDHLTYNSNGDLKTFDGWTYSYDAQNRMTKAAKGSTTVTFRYDPRNRCMKRTFNGTKTFYFFDDWNLIEERNSNDVQLQRYVHGVVIDEILSKISSGSSVYYHHDGIRDVVRLTDGTGTVAEKYSYDVFGNTTIKDALENVIPSSTYGNRFMFTGREFIKEIDLYDFRNRMNSTELGRFLQTDPIGLSAGDINLYRYVLNSPVNSTDPFGQNDWTTVGVGPGVVMIVPIPYVMPHGKKGFLCSPPGAIGRSDNYIKYVPCCRLWPPKDGTKICWDILECTSLGWSHWKVIDTVCKPCVPI